MSDRSTVRLGNQPITGSDWGPKKKFRWGLSEKDAEDMAASMSPLGTLGLPGLLDKRRWEHGIPDSAFDVQPSFESVYIFQVPLHDGETFSKDSRVLKPESSATREAKESPRGIIVGAGLTAMDELKSHGMDLGHLVTIIKLAPYRVYCSIHSGKWDYLLDLRAGDIHGSVDTATLLREGKIKLVDGYTKEGGFSHHYVNAEGEGSRSITNPVQDDD